VGRGLRSQRGRGGQWGLGWGEVKKGIHLLLPIPLSISRTLPLPSLSPSPFPSPSPSLLLPPPPVLQYYAMMTPRYQYKKWIAGEGGTGWGG